MHSVIVTIIPGVFRIRGMVESLHGEASAQMPGVPGNSFPTQACMFGPGKGPNVVLQHYTVSSYSQRIGSLGWVGNQGC